MLTLRTLRVGFEATALAAIPGVPLGTALGLGRFRGRRGVMGVVNAGLRLPPVVLGHILWLCMWPTSPWGGGPLSGLRWLYTLDAVILAQSLLALPIVIALTAAAVQGLSPGLVAQARAYGARGPALGRFAVREGRVGVAAALMAALGAATASVGAILVVGTATDAEVLPTAALTSWGAGEHGEAARYGAIMLATYAVVAAVLTVLQHGRRPRWLPVRS